MKALDDTDKQILELLSGDARLSYREIARKLKISHANVAGRVESMEKNGIIRGYTVVLNLEEFDLYPLCLQISIKPGAEIAKIGQLLSSFDEVSIVSRVTGECDLLVLAVCQNKNTALKFMSNVSGIEGISRIESHAVIEAIKLSPKWQVQPKRKNID